MSFAITAPYAAALTLIFVALTQLVIRARVQNKVPLGDGGNITVLLAMRRQANFAENVPLALLLLAFAEGGGAGATVLNGLGLALLAARLVHPFGIRANNPGHPARIAGAVTTTGVQLILVALIAVQHFA